MIDVSVVVVSWNTASLLQQTLLSLQEIQENLQREVIVVDNASSDSSVVMVREQFPDILLIENQYNLGFAKAVNQGIQKAQGNAILLLNSDAKIFPNTLLRLYEVLFSESQIGAVGAQLIYQDGTLQNSVDLFPDLWTELFNKSLLKILFPNWYPGKRSGFQSPVEVPVLLGASMMVKKKMIDEVGTLDEDYFFFMEETDWCYRMAKVGWKRVFVPGVQVLHLQGQSAKQVYLESKVEYYRSRYLFFKKHHSLFARILLILGLNVKIICGMAANGIGYLCVGKKHAKLERRLRQYVYLFVWHLKGCPSDMGLTN